jgi:small conductance mechanosensitive channel
MTASSRLLSAWHSTAAALQALSGPELVLNLLFTGLVVAGGGLMVVAFPVLVRNLARRLPGLATADKMVRTRRMLRLATALLRAGAIAGVLILVGEIWGAPMTLWLTHGLGERFSTSLVRLAILAFLAAAATEISGFLIGQGVGRAASAAEEPRRKAQLRTLGPLLVGVARSAILIVAVLMALGEVGVKIGPLLAGAGVVGIALGFGAQSLVKDLLTGVFLIVEDIVTVGDIVQIGGSGGLVEQMTLRTIRLRDFDGTLHVFPYGEAQVVHNLTKTYSYYVFDLQISYGSDIDRALAVMRQVGHDLQQDPQYRDKILEPIEVVGVDSLADSGVALKARIKTQPIQQWTVGREYNRRIKMAFDQAGVEIPFPHMKVVLPEGQLHELVRH